METEEEILCCQDTNEILQNCVRGTYFSIVFSM